MSYGDIDSWTIELDGIRYRVDLDPDYESNAHPAGQGDCYSPEDIRAHELGLWQFVGVTVSPMISSLDGETLGASLWSVEYGTMPAETEPHEGGQHDAITTDRAYLESTYPVPDLVSEVRDRLRKLRASLQALPLDDCEATHPDHPGIVNAACRRAAGHAENHSSDFGEWPV